MTSRAVEKTWIRTGGYRRLRGEWVKDLNLISIKTLDFFYDAEINHWVAASMAKWSDRYLTPQIVRKLLRDLHECGIHIYFREQTIWTPPPPPQPSQSLHCVQVSSLQTGDLNSGTTLSRKIGKGMLFFLLKQLHCTCSVGKTWEKTMMTFVSTLFILTSGLYLWTLLGIILLLAR